MIDIGVNLTSSRFDKDRELVIASALEAGLTHLLITGTSVEESEYAVRLAQQNSAVLAATAGVHPHYADNVTDDFIDQLTLLANNDAVKAIGECGLDFNRNFSTPQQQLIVFEKQIQLAAQLDLPLFLHQRDAFDAWFKLLSPFIDKVPAMVSHCFTGDKADLQACIDVGMYIGVTGWVCDERRGRELQDAVKYLPLSNLLIETDAPYLTPRTIRPRPKSSRNEPRYLRYVAEQIAQIKQTSVDEIIYHSTENAKQVFNL